MKTAHFFLVLHSRQDIILMSHFTFMRLCIEYMEGKKQGGIRVG